MIDTVYNFSYYTVNILIFEVGMMLGLFDNRKGIVRCLFFVSFVLLAFQCKQNQELTECCRDEVASSEAEGASAAPNISTGLIDSNSFYSGEAKLSSSNHFYFSYDDSASTASVELVKYMLENDMIPDRHLSRPWEFFNFETFEESVLESLGTFKVSIGLKHNSIGSSSEATNQYHLGIHLKSPSQSKAQRKSTVLTLLVDTSGSMTTTSFLGDDSYSLLELVQRGLTTLTGALKEGDIVNLVSFSDESRVLLENVQYSQLNGLFLPQVRVLQAGGSTNLYSGIQKAYKIAGKHHDKNKWNRVIILTDAYANVGEVDSATISKFAKYNEADKIYFSGLGIGANFNEAFLNELTEAGRGAYFSLVTKNDAERAFRERFIALLSVAAGSVRFRLDFPSSLSHLSSASEEVSQNKQEVQPTNFSYNTSQYFYETFGDEDELDNDEKFTLTISYIDSDGNSVEETTTKTIRQILNREISNIRDSEAIYLLNRLIAEELEPEDVLQSLSQYDSTNTSALFRKYKGLITKFAYLIKKKKESLPIF